MLTARQVVGYIDQAIDGVTPRKLQALLSIAQGFHMAMHGGDPLFEECEATPPPAPRDCDRDDYLPEESELLDAVVRVYGPLPDAELARLSRGGPPTFSELVEAGRRGEALGDHPAWPITSFVHQRRKAIAAKFASIRPKLRALAERSEGFSAHEGV